MLRTMKLLSTGIISIAALVISTAGSVSASTLVPQTAMPGDCIPQFSVEMPVFGPGGALPRVDALLHPVLTVKMKEVGQKVLPDPWRASYPANHFDVINQVTKKCPRINFQDTRVWAYETSDSFSGKTLGPSHWPGVTLEATRYAPTVVEYDNDLPAFNRWNSKTTNFFNGLVQGLLSIDQTIHWADPLNFMCDMMTPSVDCTATPKDPCCKPYIGPVPTVPHLHGAEVPPAFDGGPLAWFTETGKGPGYSTLGNPGPGKAIYLYNNTQEPGTLWFHDHALGATRTNVYSGLEAFYLIRDKAREPSNLPSGPYEIEMLLQDRQFDTNSQLFFPDGSGADVDTSNLNGPPTNPNIHPLWNPEFIGDVALVNGAPWPVLKVEPRRYHFRLLDGSNARVYRLTFGKAPVYQIGADDNYLDTPVSISQVFIAPAERADIIVDFSKLRPGEIVTVTNDAPVPFPDGLYPVPHDGLPADQPQMAKIMQFKVVGLNGKDSSCNPAFGQCKRPTPVLHLTDGKGNITPGVKIDKVRQIILKEHGGAGGPIEVLLNNTHFDGKILNQPAPNIPADGVSEQPRVGSIELWEIINLTMDAHPIHTHLVQFEILNRETFDVDGTQGSNIPGGYIGLDDGVNPPVPGAWPNAYVNELNSPLCFNIDLTGAVDDPFNPCPGFGPPLPYSNNGRTITLSNGQTLPVVGGNPDIAPYLLNDAKAPEAQEASLKDTAKANPGQIMRILMRWAPTSIPLTPNKSLAGVNLYPFDPTKGDGYLWHCHILDHEDNDMMRPYKVSH
jgi:spore coat protein A